MRQNPFFVAAEKQMQPGILTLNGFLGHDKRSLQQIIFADEATIKAAGITHTQIVARLEALASEGSDIMERKVLVANRYLVSVRSERGLQPSPFGDGSFKKGDVTLTDQKTELTICWNSLCLHMLKTYGFYGGIDSIYRIDPHKVLKILEMDKLE